MLTPSESKRPTFFTAFTLKNLAVESEDCTACRSNLGPNALHFLHIGDVKQTTDSPGSSANERAVSKASLPWSSSTLLLLRCESPTPILIARVRKPNDTGARNDVRAETASSAIMGPVNDCTE